MIEETLEVTDKMGCSQYVSCMIFKIYTITEHFIFLNKKLNNKILFLF